MASRREDKLIRTIQAKADDGRVFEIREIQEYLIDDGDRIPNLKRFEQSNGKGVNLLPNGDFELVTIGVIATPV